MASTKTPYTAPTTNKRKPMTRDEIDRQLAIEAKRRALSELAGANDPKPVTMEEFKQDLKQAPSNIKRSIMSGYSGAKSLIKKGVNALTTDELYRRGKEYLAPEEKKMAEPGGYKKGGKVKKTGMALVHKGEVVLTAKQAKKMKPAKPPTPKPYPKKTVFVAATKASKGRKA